MCGCFMYKPLSIVFRFFSIAFAILCAVAVSDIPQSSVRVVVFCAVMCVVMRKVASKLQNRNGEMSADITPQTVAEKPAIIRETSSASVKEKRQREPLDPLAQMVIDGIESGRSYAEISKEVADQTGWDLVDTLKKVQTFSNAYHAAIDIDEYRLGGYKYYEFMAAHDEHTCPICAALDGKHFKISEAKIGVNCPPMHLGCRCCTIAYDPDEWQDWENAGLSSPGPVSLEYLSVKQSYQIVEDCKNIIGKTSDIGTFLERYEILMDTAAQLRDQTVFETHQRLYASKLKGFLRRYYQSALKLKTERGRNARMIKLKDALQAASTKYDFMKAANQAVISVLSGPTEEIQKLLK